MATLTWIKTGVSMIILLGAMAAQAQSKICINGVCKESSGSLTVEGDPNGELHWGTNNDTLHGDIEADINRIMKEARQPRKSVATSSSSSRKESVIKNCDGEHCTIYRCSSGKLQLKNDRAYCGGKRIQAEITDDDSSFESRSAFDDIEEEMGVQ